MVDAVTESVIRTHLNADGYVAGGRKIEQSNTAIAQSGEQVIRAAERQRVTLADNDRSYNRLVASIDSGAAAQMKFERGLSILSNRLERGKIDQDEYGLRLAQLTARWSDAQQAAEEFGNAADDAAEATGGAGNNVQNASYQIADFAIQVAGGQNPLLAFSQQASQLLGGFGPWGAVIGAAASILGSLYLVLDRSGEEAERAAEKLGTFEDAVEDAQRQSARLNEELEVMRGGFRDQAELNLAKKLQEDIRALDELRQKMREMKDDPRTRGGVLDTQRERIESQSAIVEAAEQELRNYRDRTKAIEELKEAEKSREKSAEDEARERDRVAATVEELQRKAEIAVRVYEATLRGADAVRALNVELEVEESLRRATTAATMEQFTAIELYARTAADYEAKAEAARKGQEREKEIKAALAESTRDAEVAERRLAAARQGPSALADLDALLVREEALQKLRDKGGAAPDLATEDKNVAKIQQAEREMEKLAKRQKEIEQWGRQMGDATGRAFEDMILGAKSAGDAVRALGQEILRSIVNQMVTKPIANAAAGLFTSIGSSIFGFAEGGRPPLGRLSLVGEEGPELFVPDSAGTIIPADQTAAMLGGSRSSSVPQVTTYNVDMRGASAEAVAGLRALVLETNGRLNEIDRGFDDRAVAAVVDSRGRNPALFGG